MQYGEYQGKQIYSGYTPEVKKKEFEEQVDTMIDLLDQYELTSVTFKHGFEYIQVSLIDDEFHIDDVSDEYKN
jgi:hypothetical protein